MRHAVRGVIASMVVTASATTGCGLFDATRAQPAATAGTTESTAEQPLPMPVMAETDRARRFIATSTAEIDDTPGERIMIELTATEIAFPSSCNTVRADYAVVDGVLRLDNLRETLVLCSAADDAASPRLAGVLIGEPRFAVDGDVLTIEAPGVRLQLLDTRAPHPDDLPLAGRVWQVGALTGPSTGSWWDTEGASVWFDDGTVEVTVGCIVRVLPVELRTPTGVPLAAAPTGSLARAAVAMPTSTLAALPAPTTTDGAPPTVFPSTSVPSTTSPPPCDPDSPSDWALEVFAAFAAPLTVEIDIDRAELRRSDGTGIDLVAL